MLSLRPKHHAKANDDAADKCGTSRAFALVNCVILTKAVEASLMLFYKFATFTRTPAGKRWTSAKEMTSLAQ